MKGPRAFLRGDGGGDEGDLDGEGIPRPVVGPARAELPATRRAARRQAMREFKRGNRTYDDDDSDFDVEGERQRACQHGGEAHNAK